MINRLGPVVALLVLSSVLRADAIRVGPEIPVGGEPVALPYAFSPSDIATNGSDFLVVVGSGDYWHHDIYFSRFGWDGTPLDHLARPLAVTGEFETAPVVEWSGRHYLAVWSTPSGLFSRIITAAGILGPVQQVSNEPTNYGVTIAWNGSRFLLIWTTASNAQLGSRTLAVRLNEDGVPAESPFVLPFPVSDPQILTGPGTFTIIETKRLNSGSPDLSLVALHLIGDSVPPLEVTLRSPAQIGGVRAASSGTTSLLVWTWGRNMHSAYVANGGEIVEETRDIIPAEYVASVTWHRDHYIAIFSDGQTLAAIRLNRRGKPLDTQPMVIGRKNGYPPVPAASNGSRLLLSPDSPEGQPRILVTTSATSDPIRILASVPVAHSVPSQDQFAIDHSDRADLIVWTEQRGASQYDVFGRGSNGPVRIATRVLRPMGIDVAIGSGLALVVWSESELELEADVRRRGWVWGVLMSPKGEASGEPFLIAEAPNFLSAPHLVWNGAEFLVIWAQADAAGVYAARVSARGNVIDPNGFLVSPRGANPNVAWNGRIYLATWKDFRCGEQGCRYTFQGSFVVAAEISPSGIVSPSFDVARHHSLVHGLGVDYAFIKPVWSGRRWLVGWIAPKAVGYPSVPALWTLALDESGRPPAGEITYGNLIAEASKIIDPEICWTGRQFLTVFPQQYSASFGDDIAGAFIAEDGTGGAPFVISRGETEERTPQLACSATGARVVYSKVVPELGGPFRLMLRELTWEQRARSVRR